MHADNITMDFSTKHLVEVLSKNREQHAKDLENAESGYKKAYTAVLHKRLENLQAHIADEKKNKLEHFSFPSEPRGFLHKYDRMLSMLKATSDEKLPLTAQQYQCYAMDEWEEKHSFAACSGTLSSYYMP